MEKQILDDLKNKVIEDVLIRQLEKMYLHTWTEDSIAKRLIETLNKNGINIVFKEE